MKKWFARAVLLVLTAIVSWPTGIGLLLVIHAIRTGEGLEPTPLSVWGVVVFIFVVLGSVSTIIYWTIRGLQTLINMAKGE